MTLHDAIAEILHEAGKPLSTREIANRLNQAGLYVQKSGKLIKKGQVRLESYNSKIFDNINGQIILTSDKNWKTLLAAYSYLTDILRGHFNRSDLQFILASLLFFKRIYDMNSLYKEYRLHVPTNNTFYSFSSYYEYSKKWIQESKEFSPLFSNIFSNNSQFLSQLDERVQLEIFDILEQFNTTSYTEKEFGPIFEYFLHHISVEFSNSTTPYTPKYLQNLMVDILAPEHGGILYDPVCGSAGLLIESLKFVDGKLDVKGTELNRQMAQFGYMNLVMSGFFDIDLKAIDFLNEVQNDTTRYDYIIGDLPINVTYKSSIYYDLFRKSNIQPPNSNKGYSTPVLFVLSKLTDKGRAVVIVSENLLFKEGTEKEIRKLLIQQDVLECVISLPNGALRPYTNAKSSILVLNRNKPLEFRGKIKFIESVSTYSDPKSIDINTDEIISLYWSKSQESTFNYKIIEQEKLAKDLNLSASIYTTESILVEEMLSSGKAKKLGEIIEIRSGISPKKEDSGLDVLIPIAKSENLSRDIFDLYLNVEAIYDRTIYHSQYKRSLLSKECILIARIGDQLKPTLFKPSENLSEILLHNGLFALVPTKENNIIDLEYLYYQLHGEFVLHQIQMSRMGAVMSSISIDRLKEVVIPYLEISAQKDFVASQKASIIAAERAKVEERIKALNYEEEIEQKESDIVRTLVHQLRPTLVSIDLQVRAFKRIIDKYNLTDKREFDNNLAEHNDPELEGLITKPENNTLGELIKRFKDDTSHLNNVLTFVNKVMNFSLASDDKTETDIYHFIQEFANQHQEKESRVYTIEVKGEHVILLIHRPSFRELLDELIINAERHAFSDKKGLKKAPKIVFDIRKSKDRPIAIIEYQNNGKPFGITQKNYVEPFTKSQSSQGSGIGGNYVSRIIKAHGGALKINEGYPSGFHMTIEIPLHKDNQHE